MFQPTPPRRGTHARSGFSLIELVVVIMVLAIIAGLTVTIADWVRRSANYGAASHNQQAMLSNIGLFRTGVGNGKYPDRFDSLLGSDGTPSEWLHGDLAEIIAPGDATDNGLASLDKAGFKRVMDHDTDLGNAVQGSPQNSGVIERELSSDATVAFVDESTTTKTGLELLNGLFPDGIPDDVNLVLLGVGPANTAVGRTMASPPLYTELNPQETYGRYVLVVATFEPRTGRRAQVKAVVDPKGRLVNRQVSEFWQSIDSAN